MFDVFFISYDEPNAEENWGILSSRIPHARRTHGVKGIGNAHRSCASRSYTEMFYTVDGDTVVDGSFDFSFKPPEWDRRYLHLWYSRNPINNLTYGYGSVKLWPRDRLLSFSGNWLDFTTTVGNIKVIGDAIATTFFNTDPYNAWKSAFRETIKLCHNVSRGEFGDSLERLYHWLNTANDVENATMAIAGAEDAFSFFINAKGDMPRLSVINDFESLRGMFDARDRDALIPTKRIEREAIISRLGANADA